MRFEHTPFELRGIVDARPAGDRWAILEQDGRFGDARLDLSGLDLAKPVDLHVCGEFTAVVERFGCRGRVFVRGQTTMELDRGDYHPEVSVFPCAFVERDGQTILISGTDWNRLDLFNAATGQFLAFRGPTSYAEGEPVPPHFLDYFHAELHISPAGRWIAEDGWHWHPVGELRVWSLEDWYSRYPWESEDGPSIRNATQRVYFWDTPMVWLDENRLAFWGEGDDADEMKAVVRIYDAALGQEVGRLEGPEVAPAMPWPRDATRAGWIGFDRYLFAISPEHGTGVWSLAGERLHFEPGFAPRRYHPGRKEFLSWDEGGATVSRLVD